MWLFARLKVSLKLALVAGVPVIGALLLSALIARDAQQRAQTAAALGSIEDLARLTERMTQVVNELQSERAQFAYQRGVGRLESPELLESERRTDRALGSLTAFLAARDSSKLPPALHADLRSAQAQLIGLASSRVTFRGDDFKIDSLLEYYAKANDSLIKATADLTPLTDDGQLLLSISRLVAAMQVIERSSREHALLSYVFGKSEFPPGTFRSFVSLSTEQEVYLASFRTFAGDDEFKRFQRVLRGPQAEKVETMRKAALETTEETLSLDAKEWFEAQSSTFGGLRRVEQTMNEAIRLAASNKVAESRHAVRLGTGLAGAVVLISLLLALAIGHGLIRSVRVLSDAAAKVQKSQDFSIRAKKTSKDEIGLLTDAFNGMLAGIQDRDRELGQHREHLQALVEARTQELSQRNEQMRLVLDNVEQGLAMIDRDGRLQSECSRAFVDHFGSPHPGTPFHQTLAQGDENTGATLELAYEQLLADILPVEIALDQMPKTLALNGRQYSLSFTAIARDGKPDGALLVVRDITAELAARRAEAVQREQIKSFERVMRDRFGFLEFFTESRALIEKIRDDAIPTHLEKMRAIHTLKGNTAIFDVKSVSDAAHELESKIAEGDKAASEKALSAMLLAWDDFAARIVPVLGEDLGERLEVPHEELEQIVKAVHARLDHSAVEHMLVRLQREPVRMRFHRIEEQLQALARRLGKPEPIVLVEASAVRIPVAPLREFWSSFAHVVRNVVDHALEPEAERVALGKPAKNTITLRATSDLRALTIEIADDGRGISWQKVKETAMAKRLPHGSHSDLVGALFEDGVSTLSEVTSTSGRGVGMSAVLHSCTLLKGQIFVDSEPGRGTRFRFVFPSIENDHSYFGARLSAAPLSTMPPPSRGPRSSLGLSPKASLSERNGSKPPPSMTPMA